MSVSELIEYLQTLYHQNALVSVVCDCLNDKLGSHTLHKNSFKFEVDEYTLDLDC